MDIREDILKQWTKWLNNFVKVANFQGYYDEKYRLQLKSNFFEIKQYLAK